EERMRAVRARRLDEFVLRAFGRAEEAVRGVAEPAELRRALLDVLEGNAGKADSQEESGPGGGRDLRRGAQEHGRPELYDRLVAQAARLNTAVVAAKVRAEPRYRAPRNRTGPRKIGSRLVTFDCINCDKCVPVCPNDANFVYETEPFSAAYEN